MCAEQTFQNYASTIINDTADTVQSAARSGVYAPRRSGVSFINLAYAQNGAENGRTWQKVVICKKLT